MKNRNKSILHLVFNFILKKMHSFRLLLFIIKLYSQINIFNFLRAFQNGLGQLRDAYSFADIGQSLFLAKFFKCK